jgi:hypothetical protein
VGPPAFLSGTVPCNSTYLPTALTVNTLLFHSRSAFPQNTPCLGSRMSSALLSDEAPLGLAARIIEFPYIRRVQFLFLVLVRLRDFHRRAPARTRVFASQWTSTLIASYRTPPSAVSWQRYSNLPALVFSSRKADTYPSIFGTCRSYRLAIHRRSPASAHSD